MTITDCFPPTTSADNDVRSADGTKEQALDGTGTLNVGTESATTLDLMRWGGPIAAVYFFRQGNIEFATDTIPTTDYIFNHFLNIWPTSIVNETPDTLAVCYRDWGAAVGTADFQAAAASPGVLDHTEVYEATLASLSAGAYNAIPSLRGSDGSARPVIQRGVGAVTKFFGVSAYGGYEYGDTSGADNRLIISSSEEAGTTQDPYLTIWHKPFTEHRAVGRGIGRGIARGVH